MFGPVALLAFNFLFILMIFSPLAKGILYLFSDLTTLLCMLMILLWFSYFLIIDLTGIIKLEHFIILILNNIRTFFQRYGFTSLFNVKIT